MQKDKDERNVTTLFCMLLRCCNFMTLQERKALQEFVTLWLPLHSTKWSLEANWVMEETNQTWHSPSLLRSPDPVPPRSPIRTGARLISLFLLHFLPSTYLLLPPSILPNSVPLPPPPPPSPLIFWPLGIFHSIFCFGPSVPPPPSTAKAAQSPTAAAFSSQPFPGRASKDRKHYNILTYH